MTICDQNHSHLQHILSKLSPARTGVSILQRLFPKFFKGKKMLNLPRCCGCAYVMGYKDGLKGTVSNVEDIPYRDTEIDEKKRLIENGNKCPFEAYRRGLDDGMKERLSKS